MSLVRYQPWSLLNQLHGEIDRMVNARSGAYGDDASQLAAADWVPAVDIREDDDRFVIHADVPGVDPNDIDVQMDNGVLSIKGERQSESTEEQEGYKRVERVRGSFFRRFSLPDTADAESISAKSEHGVLEIVIPKHKQVQPKRIRVDH